VKQLHVLQSNGKVDCMGVQHLNPGKEFYCLGKKEEGRERGGGTEGGREGERRERGERRR